MKDNAVRQQERNVLQRKGGTMEQTYLDLLRENTELRAQLDRYYNEIGQIADLDYKKTEATAEVLRCANEYVDFRDRPPNNNELPTDLIKEHFDKVDAIVYAVRVMREN